MSVSYSASAGMASAGVPNTGMEIPGAARQGGLFPPTTPGHDSAWPAAALGGANRRSNGPVRRETLRHAAASPGPGPEHASLTPRDCYFALVQAVRQRTGPDVPLALGVTGCQRGAGVSTVATNLALAANQLCGPPTLLVDANHGQSGAAGLLQMPGAWGLWDLLEGQASFGECLHPTEMEGLTLLPRGGSPPSAATLPAHRLAPLLEQFRGEFELTLFDLPPVTQLHEQASFLAALDGVLLVVEAGRARRIEVEQARDQLLAWQARLLGIVINKQRE